VYVVRRCAPIFRAQVADRTSLRVVVSRDIPFIPTSDADDDAAAAEGAELQQVEESWSGAGGVGGVGGGGLEDEGTVIILAVTLAVVLVAITVVVVVFVCVRAAEQRHLADITDISASSPYVSLHRLFRRGSD